MIADFLIVAIKKQFCFDVNPHLFFCHQDKIKTLTLGKKDFLNRSVFLSIYTKNRTLVTANEYFYFISNKELKPVSCIRFNSRRSLYKILFRTLW